MKIYSFGIDYSLVKELIHDNLDNDYSQQNLADDLGISRATLRDWLYNKGKPSLYNLLKLCDICGTSIEKLLYNQADILPEEMDKFSLLVPDNGFNPDEAQAFKGFILEDINYLIQKKFFFIVNNYEDQGLYTFLTMFTKFSDYGMEKLNLTNSTMYPSTLYSYLMTFLPKMFCMDIPYEIREKLLTELYKIIEIDLGKGVILKCYA